MVLHNPNNWHWVDKNCLPWAREYFGSNLLVSAEDGSTTAKVSSIRSVEGDVEVLQRKGKVISLFDVAVEVAYTGTVDGEAVSGAIKIPEVAYDSDEDEYQFNITIDNETPGKAPVKALVRSKLVPQLRQRLKQFGVDLINTHGKDIQHAKETTTAKLPEPSNISASGSDESSGSSGAGSKVKSSAAYNTTELKLERTFTAPADRLYQAFLDPQMVAAWTRAKPDIRAEVGAPYSLFGGNISGKVMELDEPRKIVLTWRLRDWKPEHHAVLTLNLEQGSGETVLKVSFDGIPIGQEELVETNFENYYVRPIMLTFGFGIPSGSV